MTRLVYGVGINDADYIIRATIDGKQTTCPFYQSWKSLIERSYCPNFHARYPTYRDVTTCKEWHIFSNFKAWMEKQDWVGKCLDKDIITPGNKVYEPKNCCFVGNALNLLLTNHAAARGKYPLGVYFHKRDKRYAAACHDGTGQQKHLGYFSTSSAASAAYIKYKSNLIAKVASHQSDRRIANGLMRHAALIAIGR